MTDGKLFKFKIYLTLITITIFQNVETVPNKECKSAECQRLAKVYSKSMNTYRKPCINFYQYVCEKWTTQFPRPEDEEAWFVDREMEIRTMKSIEEMAMDGKKTGNPKFDAAKLLFKSCMAAPYLEKTSDDKKVKNAIKGVGQWPWSKVDDYYIKLGAESAVIKHGLANNQAKDRITQCVRRPVSSYGALKRIKKWKWEETQHYKAFLKTILETVGPSNLFPKNSIVEIVDDVMKFRDEFNKTIESSGQRSLTSTTIQQLQEDYDKSVAKDSAKINWLEKIRAMSKDGKDAYGAEIDKSSTVMWDYNYVLNLAKFLSSWPDSVIANHVHLYFAERQLRYNAKMLADFQQSYTAGAYASAKMLFIPEQFKMCYDNHNMRLTLGKMYVAKYFPRSMKKKVENLFEETKDLLAKQIDASNWLTKDTKKDTIQKARNIKSEIGYPDWFDPNSKTESKESDVNPLYNAAYFEPEENKIFVGASYLQWPVYSPNLPEVINYGSTMSLLGHELYHGFDLTGIIYDMYGKLNQWWPRAMDAQHELQGRCFYTQYAEYREQEIEKIKPRLKQQDLLPPTVDEDIADVMGLKLAFLGFQQKLKEHNGTCEMLPGFQTYTCEQLFFIAFASNYCTDLWPPFKETLLYHDAHSLPDIRVNAAVSNMLEFSTAFGCNNGEPLRPIKACDLWKK